jgi:mycothiol S-conjugate amidase
VQSHRVTAAAFNAAGDKRFYPDQELEAWQPAKLYYITLPRSIFRQAAEMGRKMGVDGPWNNPEFENADIGDDDALVTTRVDTRPYFDRKLEAFTAHKTQISPDSMWYKFPREMLKEALGFEYFRLAQGQAAAPDSENNHLESDLFAGLR